MTGSATFVLHSHLPYCRLAGLWPHGEEWLHEATLECYLPLLMGFRQLSREITGSLGVTINMTPILAEQLGDPLMREHFREYLADRIERARADTARFDGGDLRGKTARFHHRRYLVTQAFYEDELHADILGALRELESSGHIEIATSAATHGYLPLLNDEDAVRFQVETGVASHIRNFGRAPRSFWLPECAYKPGLERFLEEAGIKVFFVETHLVTGGNARGKTLGGMLGPYPETERPVRDPASLEQHSGTTFRPYLVGDSSVSVFARNEKSGLQVWSASHGYPGDGAYREFHKKDAVSGLQYWRVTGEGVDLAQKADYDPETALARTRDHARHFEDLVTNELYMYESGTGEPGTVLSAYDTELFGHWWLEGVQWLEWTIRGLAANPNVQLISAGQNIAHDPPNASIDLPEGSWGAGGDHRTWTNDATEWTWPEIYRRQDRARPLLAAVTPSTQQLARELLLLQSSDWQFLMTTGQAHDYAIERFNSHAGRFDELASAIESNSPGLEALTTEYESLDNPFPQINPLMYSAHRPAVQSRP